MELFRMFGEVALKGSKAVTNNLKVIDLAAERTARKLKEIPDKVETEVDVDTDKAESKIGSLLSNLGTMQGGIMTLGPAIVPVMASLTTAVGGLGSSFIAAGAGVASFAAIAIPALKGVFDASKEVEKIQEKIAKADTAKERAKALKELEAVYGGLTAKERSALKALQDFKSFWSSLVKSLQNPILDMFIKGLGTLKTTLNQLKPVFQASILAVSGLFDGMDKAVKGQQMQKFFDWLKVNVGPAITSFGTAFGNVMKGVMNLLMAFGPVSGDMQNGLVGLTQRFAEWTAGLANSQGFKDFISYVQTNGPVLMNILGQVGTLLSEVLKAMAPMGPVVLQIVNGLLQFVNWLLQLHPAIGIVLVGALQLVGAFKLFSGPIMGVINGFKSLKSGVSTAGTVFKNIGTGLKTFATGALNLLKSGLTQIGNVLRMIGPVISQLASGALRMLITGFRGLITVMNLLRVAFLTNPFGLIVTAIVAVIAIIYLLITNWDTVKAFLIKTWEYIKSVALSVWNGLVEFFKQWGTTILTVISGPIGWLIAFIVKNWDSIKAATLQIWNAIKSFFSSLWQGIKSLVLGYINWYINTIKSAWNGIKSVTTSVWNSIKSFFSDVWSNIKSIVLKGISSAWDTIKGFAGKFLDAGKALLESLAKGIKNGLAKAIEAVKNGMAEIRSYLPFSPAKEGPLKDLDKSGESFFPTWASRMNRGLGSAVQKVRSGMAKVQDQLKTVAPAQNGFLDMIKGFAQGNSAVAKYFQAIFEDGDWLNDWITHIPKQYQEMFKALGKMAANQLESGTGGGGSVSTSTVATTTPSLEAIGGITISGNTFIIREEADVKKVAIELFKLFERQARGLKGGVR